MTTRDEVANLIYRNQYPDPTSPGIKPLAERPLWEREMIFRGADKLMPLLAQAWEEGMLHGHNSPKRLLDKWEDNPYTAEAQVNGL